MIRFVFLCLLCLMLGVNMYGAAGFQWEETEKSVTVQRFPDAASVLLYDVETMTYQPDGTSVETDDFYQKVLTEKGRRDLQLLQLRFSTSYGTARFLKVEILRPGQPPRQVDIKRYSALAVDSSQMGSNIYDPSWKVLRLTVPDLQIGDTLHVVTSETTTKPRIPETWCTYIPLQSTDPILHYEVRIDAPASLPLRSTALKDPVPGTVEYREEKQGPRILYTWIARNVPQIFPEPGMPAWYTCVQRLLVSTVPDWASISRWYYRLCRPRLDAVSPEMKAKVAELIKGARTPEEKVRRIFRFVSQEIRYMGLTTEEVAPGYEPHDVKMTFANRYGVCRDKAALLAAMLELAGLKAYPVLFMAGDPKDPEVPNNYFNHAITAVELQPGKYTLMDPTYENTVDLLPAGEAEMSYLVAKPEGDTLRLSPAASPQLNRLALRTAGRVSADGLLHLRTVLQFSGVNDQIFRSALASWPEETRRQFFASRLKQAFPGARLNKLQVLPEKIRNISEPLQVTLEYTVSGQRPQDSRLFLLALPDCVHVFGFAAGEVLEYTGLQKRQYPIKLYSCSDFESEIKLVLPPGLTPVQMPPEKQDFESPAVRISLQTAWSGQELTRKYRMQTVRTRLTVQDYQELKKMLRQWEPAARARLMFRTGGRIADLPAAFAGADAVFSRSRQLILQSPEAGKTVETMRVHILNYAGVKRYSEVQIPFNPTWDTVPEIVGKVLSPDGKTVRPLAASEINIMDAPWTGQAPRYPGGRILTANFPGVQPGSVIEYTVTQSFRKRPFLSAMYSFGAHEPVLSDTLTVRFPEGAAPPRQQIPSGMEPQKGVMSRTNIPAVPREPGQPGLSELVPTWRFSYGNWQKYSRMLQEVLTQRTIGQTAARAKALELCASLNHNRDKIRAIRDFVLRNIRQAGPSFTGLPLSDLTPADRVLADGYGNSADRAILMKTMLDAVGIPAKFVPVSSLSYTMDKMEKLTEFPDADAFGTILVAAGGDQPPFYLGGGNHYDALGTSPFEDCIALDLQTGKLFVLDVRQEARDLVENFHITLQADGTGLVSWTRCYYGPAFGESARMFAEFTPEKRRRYEQEMVSGFSYNGVQTRAMEAQFDRYPGVCFTEMRVRDLAVQTGPYRQLVLPDFMVLYQAFRTAASGRKTPLERQEGGRWELQYKITFPENWQPLQVQDTDVANLHEKLHIRRRVEGHTLYITAELELRPCRTEVTDYDNLESLQAMLGAQSLRTVVFSVLQKR